VLSLGSTTRVFVARDPVDMRGSFDALAGRIRRLGLDPLDGALYVFVSRRRHLLAVLGFDGSGWCLYRKRLIRGSFQLPDLPDGIDRLPVDGRVLAAMLTGIDLNAPRRRWFERHLARQTPPSKTPF
jgi:transposase